MTDKVEVREKVVDEILERVEVAEKEATQLPMLDLQLMCGARVRITPIPAVVLQMLQKEHPEPEIPISIVKMGGKDVSEPNPNDPRYRRALDQHRLEMGDATLKLMMLRGMEILELPPNMQPYDKDETWEEELEVIGISVPKTALARKVVWMRYRILGYVADFTKVQEACWKLGGVSEEEIAAAEARFPSPSKRPVSEGLANEREGNDLAQ